MADKVYRCVVTISCDASVIDKMARANMGTIDDFVERLLAEYVDTAISVTATDAEVVTVREKSAEPGKAALLSRIASFELAAHLVAWRALAATEAAVNALAADDGADIEDAYEARRAALAAKAGA
jgi:hypothetical protein